MTAADLAAALATAPHRSYRCNRSGDRDWTFTLANDRGAVTYFGVIAPTVARARKTLAADPGARAAWKQFQET